MAEHCSAPDGDAGVPFRPHLGGHPGPGSPAALPWLLGAAVGLKRMRLTRVPLFEFGYELEWPDLDTMERCWGELRADSTWSAAKRASRRSRRGEPVLFVSDRIIQSFSMCGSGTAVEAVTHSGCPGCRRSPTT